jgi:hypothetical protein
LGWDTKAEKLHRVIYLPVPIAPKDAFVNDFTVDSRDNRIFIVDPAGGANAAFIVVDLETGAARRVLEGHSSVVPEKIDLIIDGRPIQVKDAAGHLVRPRIGVNPVTEDPNPSAMASASTRTTIFIYPIWAENSIGVIKADGSYQRLGQSAELSWVDLLSFGPEGKLYAVVNRLHQSAALNGGESLSKPPYFLIEVKALAAGLPGR